MWTQFVKINSLEEPDTQTETEITEKLITVQISRPVSKLTEENRKI